VTYATIARRIRVPLGFVLAILYIWLARPTWLSLAIGAAIALFGVAVRAAASGHITKNAALTTTGPYAYTRNPLYLGSIIIGAGFAVAALNWWIILAIATLFVAIYLPVIGSEEAFLRGAFPGYDDYARRVPRLLPRLTKETAVGGGGSFSWERYRKHREYNALLGTMMMIVALAVKLVWAR
jgi:protein-S-isoprenylcysteine O-methyltransferase Ste14